MKRVNTFQKPSTGRREFLMSAVRSLALFAFAAFAAGQEIKRRRLANDPECIRLYSCPDCVEFGRCEKPKAREVRQAESARRLDRA
jgi:hypothetical protein